MSKTAKRLARGLAAGLSSFGKQYQEEKERAEAKELASKELALRERQIKVQEQDAENRKAQHDFKMLQDRVLYKNKMLMQAYQELEGNPEMMGPALSNYTSTGYAYRYNPDKSAKLGGIAFDMGTYKKRDDGSPEVDPATGEKVFEPLPLDSGTKVFKDRADFYSHIIGVTNADFAMAQEAVEHKEKLIRERHTKQQNEKLANDKAFYNFKMQTPEGKLYIEKHKAEIDRIKAETAKTQKETELAGTGKEKKTANEKTVWETVNLKGEKVKLTDAEKQAAIANQKAFKETYGDMSVGEAYRVGKLKDDQKEKQKIALGLDLVKQGKWDRKKFRKLSKDYDVPAKFFDKMLEEMDEYDEMASEEQAAADKEAGGSKLMSLVELILSPVAWGRKKMGITNDEKPKPQQATAGLGG